MAEPALDHRISDSPAVIIDRDDPFADHNTTGECDRSDITIQMRRDQYARKRLIG